jgi:hypothetical protein
MSIRPPHDPFAFMQPWEPVRDDGHNLDQELRKEIVSGHPLYARLVRAVARRTDCNDVLFETDSAEYRYSVVHLTWTGELEQNPIYPYTQFYPAWEEWVESRMKPDNAGFPSG